MSTGLPVVIADMIEKVTNKNVHPEQRQHYASTLNTIVEEAQKALKIYEGHRRQ